MPSCASRLNDDGFELGVDAASCLDEHRGRATEALRAPLTAIAMEVEKPVHQEQRRATL